MPVDLLALICRLIIAVGKTRNYNLPKDSHEQKPLERTEPMEEVKFHRGDRYNLIMSPYPYMSPYPHPYIQVHNSQYILEKQ